jgi:hypothetical protein
VLVTVGRREGWTRQLPSIVARLSAFSPDPAGPVGIGKFTAKPVPAATSDPLIRIVNGESAKAGALPSIKIRARPRRVLLMIWDIIRLVIS